MMITTNQGKGERGFEKEEGGGREKYIAHLYIRVRSNL